GRAASFADFVGVDADNLAVLGDDHDVGLFGDLKSSDDGAVAISGLHVDDTFAAAGGDAVFGEGGALAETLFGDGEHEGGERILDVFVLEFLEVLRGFLAFLSDDFEFGLDGVHADDVIILVEIHAVDAACVAAHGAHFGFAEEDGLALVAGEEDHLLAVGELRADEFVLGIEVDGDDAGGAGIGKFGDRGFLHGAELGGHEDEAALFFEVGGGDEGGELFVFLEFHEAGDGFAARGSGGFRQLVDFLPVNAALGGEEQDVTVRGGDEEILDEVLFLRFRTDAALAAARLVTVNLDGGALDVAGM